MSLIIISGAQTGADVAGLWAAKHFGIPTGGLAPKGFNTLNGPQPIMATTFAIQEHDNFGYRERTIENLKSSDITLVCSQKMSPGTKLTINQCKKLKILHYLVQLDPSNLEESIFQSTWVRTEIKRQVDRHEQLFSDRNFILNVAGNSTQNSARSFEFTYKFCHQLFTELGYTSSIPLSDWNRYKDKWE
jgi:hypothetical protein